MTGLGIRRGAFALAGALLASSAVADVVIENARLRLRVGDDGGVRSLVVKRTGEECVPAGKPVPLFAVTQGRPFNNEVKLIHPNKRTQKLMLRDTSREYHLDIVDGRAVLKEVRHAADR